MLRRTNTYAIRLAVEGGGQVKAELVSVGQSGERSLKRIEGAGERASGGLKGLGRQAELLRTGIRTLGGALNAAALCGLGIRAPFCRSTPTATVVFRVGPTVTAGGDRWHAKPMLLGLDVRNSVLQVLPADVASVAILRKWRLTMKIAQRR